jgi:hypothetical protein
VDFEHVRDLRLPQCGGGGVKQSYSIPFIAAAKEKHGVWDPMSELSITSPDVDSNICTMGNGHPYATVDLDPKESTLSP